MERLIPMNVEQIRRQGMKNAELQRKREKEFDKKIDLLDPILHENNAIRQCYEYTR